jgi:hypothetical protein
VSRTVTLACHLSDKQRADLRDALVAAFPTRRDLDELFHSVFEEPLRNHVAEPLPMNEAVSNLIDWAQRNGKLDQLLERALGHNPGNQRLHATVGHIRSASTSRPAVDGAIALGELKDGSDLDHCVYVAAIVYDLAAAKSRIKEHIERVSRQPAIVRELGTLGTAVTRLRNRGYSAERLRGELGRSFAKLIGEANDLRMFAVIAPAAIRSSWPQQRQHFLAGLLGERFKKQDHGIKRVLTLRDRMPDTVAAVREAWARHGNSEAAPPTEPEVPAADALCGLCDALASSVRYAYAREAPLTPEVRSKLVHIYDHSTKRNYLPMEAFP